MVALAIPFYIGIWQRAAEVAHGRVPEPGLWLRTTFTAQDALGASTGFFAAAATLTVALAVAPRVGLSDARAGATRRWWTLTSLVVSACGATALTAGSALLQSASRQPRPQTIFTLIVGVLTALLAIGVDQWKGNPQAQIWRRDRDLRAIERQLRLASLRPRVQVRCLYVNIERRKAWLFTVAPTIILGLGLPTTLSICSGDLTWLSPARQGELAQYYVPTISNSLWITFIAVGYFENRILDANTALQFRIGLFAFPLFMMISVAYSGIYNSESLGHLTFTMILGAMAIPFVLATLAVSSRQIGPELFERYGYIRAAKAAAGRRERLRTDYASARTVSEVG